MSENPFEAFVSECYVLCAVFGTTENATEMAQDTVADIIDNAIEIGNDPIDTVLFSLSVARKNLEFDKSGVFKEIVNIWENVLAELFSRLTARA